MDKKFHALNCMQESGAASVSVLAHPEHAASGASVADARADLVTALMGVLAEGKASIPRTATTHADGLVLAIHGKVPSLPLHECGEHLFRNEGGRHHAWLGRLTLARATRPA